MFVSCRALQVEGAGEHPQGQPEPSQRAEHRHTEQYQKLLRESSKSHITLAEVRSNTSRNGNARVCICLDICPARPLGSGVPSNAGLWILLRIVRAGLFSPQWEEARSTPESDVWEGSNAALWLYTIFLLQSKFHLNLQTHSTDPSQIDRSSFILSFLKRNLTRDCNWRHFKAIKTQFAWVWGIVKCLS